MIFVTDNQILIEHIVELNSSISDSDFYQNGRGQKKLNRWFMKVAEVFSVLLQRALLIIRWAKEIDGHFW